MNISTNIDKIQRVSYFFRKIFQVLIIAIPLALTIFWINAQYLRIHYSHTSSMFLPSEIVIAHALTATNTALGLSTSLLFKHSFTMLILYFLIALFKLYEKGEIFAQRSVNYLKNIGYTLLIGQIANVLYDLIMSFALTFNNPPGQRYSAFTFGTGNVYVIFIALMVILISWIMSEGCKLQEEQKYTV